MKKELFEYEITILKKPFNRSLRRKAKTNLKKIINKTNSEDLTIVFKCFKENQKVQVCKLIERGTQTIEFLTELGETLVEKLLTLEDSNRIATGLLITISINNLRALLYLIIAGNFLNM